MAQSPDLKLTILRSARFTEFAQNPNKIPIRDCFGQGPIHPFQEVCDRFPNPIAALSKRFRGAVIGTRIPWMFTGEPEPQEEFALG